jgi:hypothetical protein
MARKTAKGLNKAKTLKKVKTLMKYDAVRTT